MKICAFVLLFVFCYVQCRKTYPQIDKNANVAFINMEGGGIRPAPANIRPSTATPPKTPEMPKPTPAPQPAAPTTVKPATPTTVKHTPPTVTSPKTPNQITPKPVHPVVSPTPITTPGPGSVKQLITFYDSQGKASPIRPYTYSQAVKQG